MCCVRHAREHHHELTVSFVDERVREIYESVSPLVRRLSARADDEGYEPTLVESLWIQSVNVVTGVDGLLNSVPAVAEQMSSPIQFCFGSAEIRAWSVTAERGCRPTAGRIPRGSPNARSIFANEHVPGAQHGSV